MRRTVSIQQLLEQMHGRDPVAEVLQRLAALLDARVLLFGPAGQLVVECVPAPAGEEGRPAALRLWKAYATSAGGPAPAGFFTAERWAVSCREVRVRGTLRWVLMAARPKGETTDEFVESAVAYVQRLLEVDLDLRRDLLRVRTETGVALLEDLIAWSSSQPDLVERLSRHGIGSTEPYRVLVMRPARTAGPASRLSQAAGTEGPMPDAGRCVRTREHADVGTRRGVSGVPGG